MQRISLLT